MAVSRKNRQYAQMSTTALKLALRGSNDVPKDLHPTTRQQVAIVEAHIRSRSRS